MAPIPDRDLFELLEHTADAAFTVTVTDAGEVCSWNTSAEALFGFGRDEVTGKAYIDREVSYHQQVIDALDKTLIPGAKSEELKALLVIVRPAFVAHREHAKQLRSSLNK